MTVAVDAEITALMQCLQRQRNHVLGAVEGLSDEALRRAVRTSTWAGGGNSSRSNHPMSSCSSGATFAGVPSQSRTSQALRSAGSSAGPAVSRHR